MTCDTCEHLRRMVRWPRWVCLALRGVAFLKTRTDSHCSCYVPRGTR